MKIKTTTILLIMLSANVFSDTLQVNPSKDNTLYESTTGNISNGAGLYTYIGKTGNNDSQKLRRALTKFDVSAIPSGSVINSVTVSFTVSKVPPGAQSSTADLHLLLTDWGERASDAGSPGGGGATAQIGDATWIHTFFDSQMWSNAGGNFNPTSSQATNYGTANGETISFASNNSLIADVQLWVDTPADNFGWIVIGDEVTVKNTRRLNTRESAAGTPVLMIDYTINSDFIFTNGFE